MFHAVSPHCKQSGIRLVYTLPRHGEDMTTNIEIKNAKPKENDYTLNVDKGLSILVKTTGSKLWRYRYSFASKRCMISLGAYPQVSIKDARAKQRECLDLLDKGINPSANKQTEKAKQSSEKSFSEAALEWHARHYQHSTDQRKKVSLRRLEKYILPTIGKVQLKDIEAPMLFNLIESVQDSGRIETGKRVNSYCSMIFRYGVAKGYCSRDLTQDYKGMLKSAKSKNMPTLVKSDEIGELLRDINDYPGTIIVKSALHISAYIFVRPKELANSKWNYIDFENSQWIIPAEQMKLKRDHLIPISSQVKAILKALRPITGDSEYIFPNEKDSNRHMHNETVNKTLRRIKDGKYIGRIVSHGFRAMASTILNENQFRSDVIEKQLAHEQRNKVRGAYNRAEYLKERTEMMQWYADYLDGLNQ